MRLANFSLLDLALAVFLPFFSDFANSWFSSLHYSESGTGALQESGFLSVFLHKYLLIAAQAHIRASLENNALYDHHSLPILPSNFSTSASFKVAPGLLLCAVVTALFCHSPNRFLTSSNPDCGRAVSISV